MNPYIKPTVFLLTLFNPVSVFAQTQLQDGSTYSIGGSWSPYLVGGLIGLLTWLTFYFSEHPIGASSFYATVAGLNREGSCPPAYRQAPLLQGESAQDQLGVLVRARDNIRISVSRSFKRRAIAAWTPCNVE